MRKLDNVFKAVVFAILAFAFYELKAESAEIGEPPRIVNSIHD